jgi:hypothetical protein
VSGREPEAGVLALDWIARQVAVWLRRARGRSTVGRMRYVRAVQKLRALAEACEQVAAWLPRWARRELSLPSLPVAEAVLIRPAGQLAVNAI